MNKLLNQSLKQFLVYSGIVLACSIPVYYIAISMLWQYELSEHHIILTPEADREDSFLIIGAVTLLSVFFFALLLGGFVLLNRRISRRLWQPFYRSLAQIKNFNLNQQAKLPFEPTNIAEFAELNASLDKLIDGNIAVYAQQKEFADNASHELQTPLSIVQSKLELLLQSQTLRDEQYKLIEEAVHALLRVGRINKNLLLLTKIENSQFTEKEDIDLSGLVEDTVLQFIPFSQDKEQELQTSLLPGTRVQGNRMLIEILLNNLMTNAIRHSPPRSPISIDLSGSSLVIANAGSVPLDASQLFKRFSSASTQTPGTGLGLSLIQQVCNRYNWQVVYAYYNGRHIFSVRF